MTTLNPRPSPQPQTIPSTPNHPLNPSHCSTVSALSFAEHHSIAATNAPLHRLPPPLRWRVTAPPLQVCVHGRRRRVTVTTACLPPSIPSESTSECAIDMQFELPRCAQLLRCPAPQRVGRGCSARRPKSADVAQCRNKRRPRTRRARAAVPGRECSCAWAARQVRANRRHACERLAREAVSSNFFT